MARASYIYLIYLGDFLLSAHTVKHEAHTWLKRSKWTPEQTRLVRMRDGAIGDITFKERWQIEWEF
jgi:hypothetical protein